VVVIVSDAVETREARRARLYRELGRKAARLSLGAPLARDPWKSQPLAPEAPVSADVSIFTEGAA
jgi:hypothetical protein